MTMNTVEYYRLTYQWPNGVECTFASANLTTSSDQRAAHVAMTRACGGMPTLLMESQHTDLPPWPPYTQAQT